MCLAMINAVTNRAKKQAIEMTKRRSIAKVKHIKRHPRAEGERGWRLRRGEEEWAGGLVRSRFPGAATGGFGLDDGGGWAFH